MMVASASSSRVPSSETQPSNLKAHASGRARTTVAHLEQLGAPSAMATALHEEQEDHGREKCDAHLACKSHCACLPGANLPQLEFETCARNDARYSEAATCAHTSSGLADPSASHEGPHLLLLELLPCHAPRATLTRGAQQKRTMGPSLEGTPATMLPLPPSTTRAGLDRKVFGKQDDTEPIVDEWRRLLASTACHHPARRRFMLCGAVRTLGSMPKRLRVERGNATPSLLELEYTGGLTLACRGGACITACTLTLICRGPGTDRNLPVYCLHARSNRTSLGCNL